MRRKAHRAEEWIEIPRTVCGPASGAMPALMMFPGDVPAEMSGEWTFPSELDLHIKVLAIDTSTRIGKLTLAVGHGPEYEGRAVVEGPLRRRTLAPRRLARGMRRHMRRMIAEGRKR